MKKILLLFVVISISCKTEKSTFQFSKKALNDTFLSENNTEIQFKDIIKQYKGKKVLIDIWATWCKDCIVGFPDVKKLQNKHKDVVFLFLSLDKEIDKWKNGIEKHNLQGEHYYISSGWKGDFCSSINLDWVPRYMVINKNGEITLFKAIKATDNSITKALND